MDLGPHAAFIVSAYAIATALVAAMIAWIVVDHRQQTRRLAELEARGVTRRSERGAGQSLPATRSGLKSDFSTKQPTPP
jgi:heme exporter protein D